MSSLLTRSSIAAFPVYAFGGVELDKTNQLLRIDDKVHACPELVFRFLLLLCESPHQLILREELIDHLWPGGQVISDEAITQVLFRARTILGPYGSQIKTVRGKGVRLDAVVSAVGKRAQANLSGTISKPRQAISSNSIRAVSQDKTTAQNPVEQQKTSQWAKPGLWVACLVAVSAVFALVFWSSTSSPPAKSQFVNAGFGLMSGDLHASNAETERLIQEAFNSEAKGERSRCIELLEAIHRSDPQTPIPAIFLALWIQGSGDALTSMKWIEQARERSTFYNDAYLNLLMDYVEAEASNNVELIISRAGALLDIRPDAWRMHHARAHLMEFSGMREAALREIKKIEVTEFGERKLDSVIADRASMGDIDGAQAMLDRIPAESDPATYAFLSGRLAWSRGDVAAAHEFWIEAAKLAYPVARMDIYRRALLYAGAIEAAQGQDETAVRTLQSARNAMADSSIIDYTDVSLLLAHLHSRAGRIAEMHSELDSAINGSAHVESDWIHLASLFSSLRLWPERPVSKPDNMEPSIDALWQAMQAYANGDIETARETLALARASAVGHTRFSDEARWLEWKLGEAVSTELPIDPPYPPLMRLMVRREIQSALTASSTQVAATLP